MISSTHMGKVEQGATNEVKCRIIGMLLSPPIHKVYPVITVKFANLEIVVSFP
jgi:hypothetical protein